MDNKAFQNIQKKLRLTNEGTAEALDTELFVVQQWASGVWPIPRPIAKFLYTLLSIRRDNFHYRMDEYRDGYLEGYKVRKKEDESNARWGYTGLTKYVDGYADGYTEGQERGRSTGYTEGYEGAMGI